LGEVVPSINKAVYFSSTKGGCQARKGAGVTGGIVQAAVKVA